MPFSGIRILDLSRIFAGPYCTQTLADMGADVIKVERPVAGDEMRNYGPPFLKNREGKDSRESSYYVAANRNKRAITVDLARPEGQEIIRQLAAISDVVVENYKVGDLKRHGLDYESIKAVNPRIIYASITGFGQHGPYKERPGLDGCFQAMSGLMSITGQADGPPQRTGFIVSDTITSLFTTVAIISALYHRNMNNGPGQYIDMALLDSQLAGLSHRATAYFLSGEVPKRQGNSTPASFPSDIFPCADGSMFISASADDQFRRLLKIIGHAELIDDPRCTTRTARLQNRAFLQKILVDALAPRTMLEWADDFAEGNIISAAVNTMEQAFNDPHVKTHDVLMRVPHPDSATGTVPILRSPMKFSETPITKYTAPPQLGQHTDEVLKGVLGMDEATLARLKESKVI